MRDVKILLIDDEVVDVIDECLEDLKIPDVNLCTDKVDNFKDAVKKIEEQKQKKQFYEIVIVDMKMDGSEEKGLDVVVLPLPSIKIVLTALASVENCIKCLRLGVYDYIDKNSIQYDPFERLKEAIKNGLADRLKEPVDPFTQWKEDNNSRLNAVYKGQYIAVIGDMVVDADKNRDKLKNQVKKSYPFFYSQITKIS